MIFIHLKMATSAETCCHELYVLIINCSSDLVHYFNMVYEICVSCFSETFVEMILCFSKHLGSCMCCV